MINIYETTNLEEILRLLRFFDKDFSPTLTERIGSLEVYAKKLFNNSYTFYVQSNEKIIGFASIYMNEKVDGLLYIAQIAARSDTEHLKGIGSYILEFIINLAKINGKRIIELEVHKENQRAISLYQKYKFEIEKTPNYDYLKMVKIL